MRKSYRTFTPTGPAVLPIDDPATLPGTTLRLRCNGELRQEAPLSQLIVGVEELVALASSIVRLQPGDLILTGTPSGVGPIVPGDRLELAVDGLPTLETTVSTRAAVAGAR